jgi:hypothetical protein
MVSVHLHFKELLPKLSSAASIMTDQQKTGLREILAAAIEEKDKTTVKDLVSFGRFCVEVGLYDPWTLEPGGMQSIRGGTDLIPKYPRFYCPHCNDFMPWQTSGLGEANDIINARRLGGAASITAPSRQSAIVVNPDENIGINYHNIEWVCRGNRDHVFSVNLRLDGSTIQKVGQYPSHADFSIAEYAELSNQLEKGDRREFNKALGLFAHKVGIGSFVYLRRILENLVERRFHELKDKNEWDVDEFRTKKMDDKVAFLKDYLPDYLVENKIIYGILSKGIHELEEPICIGAFPLLRDAILTILRDDAVRKAELKQRKQTAKDLQALAAVAKKPPN